MVLSVHSFYNPGGSWPTCSASPLISSFLIQSQPSGLSRTPQVRAGWWLWPLAPELKQGSESCCSQASLSPTHALLYGLIFPVVKVQLQARLTTQPELAPRPQNTARCPSVRSPSWSHCVGTCPPQLDGELFDTGDPFS